MFVKETTVRRGSREYTYLQMVEGYRDERGRVRHRVVANLGRKDALKASGQLEPLVGVRREVGALLLAAHVIGELDLVATIDRVLPTRGRAQLSVGEVAAALVCSRLCSPSPLYDVAGWASGAAVQELLGVRAALLNDDRLGRALETFAVYAEHLRGAVAARAIERFGLDAGRLHVDLTTVRVAGAYEHSALVAKGWGSDRHVARQVRALQAATADGVLLYLRPDPGSAAELTLVGAALERLLELSSPGLLMIGDSALGRPKTLCQIDRAGLQFIVPLRADTGFRERYLAQLGARGPRDRPDAPLARRLHPLLRAGARGRQRARARARQGRRAARARPARPRRALLQDQDPGPTTRRPDRRDQHRRPDHHQGRLARRQADAQLAARPGRDRARHRRRRHLRARDQQARPTLGRARARALQGPRDRRAPPPRPQTDAQGAPDLPPQRRPHPRARQHRRHRAADLRPDRVPTAPSARRPTARPAARGPSRQAHRPQRPRRLPRPRPHLHHQRTRPRPPHPHPAPHPRPPRDPAALATTGQVTATNCGRWA